MNYDDYKLKTPLPQKHNFKQYFVYKQGQVLLQLATKTQLIQFLMSAKPKDISISDWADLTINQQIKHLEMLLDVLTDENGYSSAVKDYNEEKQHLYKKFEKDVIEEEMLEKHPCSKGMFAYAWQNGHSSGLQEVHNILIDLAEYIVVND